jgi:hypothetical protein
VSAPIVALLALILGQTSRQAYAGTWIAELEGTTYARLELAVTGTELGGRISLGDIHVDRDGEVDSAKAIPQKFTPLVAVDLRDSGLAFSRRDDDDVDRFEMHLIGDGVAELVFQPTAADRQELADNGIPVPKPFRLKRVVP